MDCDYDPGKKSYIYIVLICNRDFFPDIFKILVVEGIGLLGRGFFFLTIEIYVVVGIGLLGR